MGNGQVDSMAARVAALEAKILELEASNTEPSTPEPDPERPVSRRRLIGMAGAAAAGAVGATALASSPAGATAVSPGVANGDALQIGGSNGCAGQTSLLSTAGLVAFTGVAGSANSIGVQGTCDSGPLAKGVKGTSSGGVGVAGESNTSSGTTGIGPVNGVHGTSGGVIGVGVRGENNSGFDGIGVLGQAATGIGLYGLGGRTPLYLSPAATLGAPSSGNHAMGEFFVDSSGALFYNTAGGTPGNWQKALLGGPNDLDEGVVTSLTGTNDEAVLFVENVSTDPGESEALRAVYAISQLGDAIEGAADTGNGVMGDSNSGVGVVGSSDTGTGVHASGGGFGLRISSAIHMKLDPGSTSGAPTANAHGLGEFFMDSAGQLFQCAVAGTPGTWVNLTATSAGPAFVPLSSPVRVFDSRGGPNMGGTTLGALTFTGAAPSAAFRDVNCSQNAATGATVVPPGATTLLMNLAVVTVSGVGALNAYATGTPQPNTANINWSSGGQVLSNSVTSACSAARHVNFAIVASAGASTHFIVDVIGYYS